MQLQRFDLLFVRGETPIISDLVKWITNSPFSHVAVYFGNDEVAETNWWYPLKKRPMPYSPDQYEVFRYKEGLTLAQQQAMESFFNLRKGSGYDLWQSVSHGIYLLTGYPIADDAERFNCSEFVDRLYSAAGIELSPEVLGHVTPGDLAKSELLYRVS